MSPVGVNEEDEVVTVMLALALRFPSATLVAIAWKKPMDRGAV
jgi:hypothetical protein